MAWYEAKVEATHNFCYEAKAEAEATHQKCYEAEAKAEPKQIWNYLKAKTELAQMKLHVVNIL